MVAIDVSYSQSTNIDFVALRRSGVDTVIMKAGGSNTGSRYVDSKYRWFEPRARAAGMRIGHYWFNGFGDPVGDAQFFVSNLYDYRPGDLLALDCESEGSMPYWGPDRANAFRDEVQRLTGSQCDVYMSSSVTRAQNWSSTAARSGLWVAQYGSNSGVPQGAPNIAYWPTYKLWQYTSNAILPGYAGRLDANIVNETQWAGGGSTPIPTDDEEMISQDTQNWLNAKFEADASAVRRESRSRLYKNATTGEYVAINWDVNADATNRILYIRDENQARNLASIYQIVGDSPENAKVIADAQWQTLLNLANGSDSVYSPEA
jgi:GH25 family lysozyme M1 (1,4-beta-N-acetylmuramidase)